MAAVVFGVERGDEAGCCPLGSAEHFPEILRHCRKVVISMSCIVFGSSPAPSPSKKFKLWFDPFAVQVASSIQEVQRQAKRCANKFANCSLSLSLFVSPPLVNLRASLLWKGHSVAQKHKVGAFCRPFTLKFLQEQLCALGIAVLQIIWRGNQML